MLYRLAGTDTMTKIFLETTMPPEYDVVGLVAAVFPIALLVYLMTKRNAEPSYVALPIAAAVAWALRMAYFGSDPNLVNAGVLSGLLTAWTPILIVWGAVLFFKTMELSGAMDVLRVWLQSITTSRIGQLMLIAWAFGFLVEGASGFGTPAALCAPLLVGLGFNPVRVAIVCLIMNSVPVSFGAVGTPTWYGLGELGLAKDEILVIGFRSALIHGCAAFVIPAVALSFVIPFEKIRKSAGFIVLSSLSCVVPYVLLATVSYEFPSLLGGGIGLLVTAWLAHKNVLLEKDSDEPVCPPPSTGKLIKAAFPVTAVIVVLLITRIPDLGLKALLTSEKNAVAYGLGSLGRLSVSPMLAVRLDGIFGTSAAWDNKFLYVPSIIPFLLVSVICFFVFGMRRQDARAAWTTSFLQMKKPILALSGALVLVKILGLGGDASATQIIGRALADAAGRGWQFFAAYLGALGAFFAGSNTVSNLTFSGIQVSISESLGLPTKTILALQSVGGAMGNMVCIHNIVAVCSILGIDDQEGFILKRTVIPMLIYGVIAGIVGALVIAAG